MTGHRQRKVAVVDGEWDNDSLGQRRCSASKTR